MKYFAKLMILLTAILSCTYSQSNMGMIKIASFPTLSGKSPVFDIELNQTKIVYNGIEHTKHIGRFSISINNDAYQDLYNQLSKEANISNETRRDYHKITVIINNKKSFLKSSSQTVKNILNYIDIQILKKKKA